MIRQRFRAGLAVLALAAGALAVPAAAIGSGLETPASADASRCASSQVAVAVNFSHWGNPVRLGCAAWTSSMTGYDALRGAGFAVTGTTRYGPAFVCRIDGDPTAGAPDHEACVSTPSASSYWSYWHANAGQTSWTYSTLGATSYHPHPGSVDAWTFGGGAQPPFAPSSVLPLGPVRPTTSAAPTSRARPAPPASGPARTSTNARGPDRSTAGNPSAPGGRTGSGRTGSGRTGSARTGSPATASSRRSAAPSTPAPGQASTPTTSAAGKAGAGTTRESASSTPAGAAGGTSTGSSGPSIVANDVAAARPNRSGGSAGPTLAAIAVIAALAAAGGGYAWRRRRQTDLGG